MPLSSGSASPMSPARQSQYPNPSTPATSYPYSSYSGFNSFAQSSPLASQNNPYSSLIQQMLYGDQGVISAGNMNVAGLYGQQQNASLLTQAQKQALQQQTGTSLAQNLLAGQNIGVQEQQNELSAQLATALQGINTQQYGLTQQGLKEQQQQATYGYQTGKAQQLSAGAASGVAGSPGQAQAMQTLGKQYGWSQADIARQMKQAKLGYQSSTEQYQVGQQQTALQQQSLENLAKSNGLSAQQLHQQLANGLNQLGLSGYINIEQLESQIGQALGSNDTNVLGILSPLFISSGLNLGSVRNK